MEGFCEAIRVLALIRLDDLSKSEEKLKAEAELVHKHKSEFDAIIADKNASQLGELEQEIDKILTGDQFTLDIDYWDFLLMMVKRQKSILTIKDFLNEFKKASLRKKDARQNDGENEIEVEFEEKAVAAKELEVSIAFDEHSGEFCDDELTEDDFAQRLAKERTNILNGYFEDFISSVIEENTDDKNQAAKYTEQVLTLVNEESNSKVSGNRDQIPDSFSAYQAIVRPSKPRDGLAWIDEFKPRRPHYFNRVKLGYEWSKINQAHYTVDNPPPREVVGYKFNIFYPNLLDQSKTPSFKLLPTENPELVVITFIAGPPYEDISFRLVNKQWDMADRKNFKCVFDRGILCLYFDFVKNRYRR